MHNDIILIRNKKKKRNEKKDISIYKGNLIDEGFSI